MNQEKIQLPPELLRDILRTGTETISNFAAKLTQSALGQLNYDLTENVPAGICALDEAAGGHHALEHGIASAVNSLYEWSCEDAIRIASAILEDANCHAENAALLAAAKANVVEVAP